MLSEIAVLACEVVLNVLVLGSRTPARDAAHVHEPCPSLVEIRVYMKEKTK